MICQNEGCRGTIRITHTYSLESLRFSRAVCRECGTLHRVDSRATVVQARGDGARALAARHKDSECEASSSSPF